MESKPKDGDILIIEADELIRDDRWRASEVIRRGLDVVKGDYAILITQPDNFIFMTGINRDKMKELSKELDIELDKQQEKELLKEMISRMPEGSELKCDQIILVKTQGRIGSRKQLKKIYDKLGAETGDFLSLEFVNNEIYGRGWFVNLLKKSAILSYFKEKTKYIEGDKKKTLASAKSISIVLGVIL